ncbi:6-phosphogluconolactonase [Glaciihabitans sp. dw_435]|uniref:6-phosphogluconolactonase n=1 Tax=Glaciihabitans sp. dw_435 TaxID=2720081 RepID=UPI001BD68FD2|nr:6-phosphogluconolactonase [Glaciihabitans sp. dw_435]
MTTTTFAPDLLVHADAEALGRAAAAEAGAVLRSALARAHVVRLMLAAAPSQEPTLRWLAAEDGIDWSRIESFHMDDYIGLNADAPQGFGNWLLRNFFRRLPATTFHRIDTANEPENEATRYGQVMGDAPFDLVLLGLGVNGHLAFNDPPAEFASIDRARVVELDMVSRQQQVDEGHFPSAAAVPSTAITVTISRLLNAQRIIGSIPGTAKKQAVWNTLHEPIGAIHPGTALRTHPAVSLHVDLASAPENA